MIPETIKINYECGHSTEQMVSHLTFCGVPQANEEALCYGRGCLQYRRVVSVEDTTKVSG